MPTGFAEPIESIDESLKDLARFHLHSDTFSVHAGEFIPGSFSIRFSFAISAVARGLVFSSVILRMVGWPLRSLWGVVD